MDINTSDPIKILISELLEAKYDGVTFSEEIIDSMEAKVSPMVRKQTEELVSEYVADFFNPKKPIRKPRKTKVKTESEPKTQEATKEENIEESVTPVNSTKPIEAPTPPSSPIL